METISWADFEKVELRIGTIIEVEDFPEARVPAFKLKVDFGEEIAVDAYKIHTADLSKLIDRH